MLNGNTFSRRYTRSIAPIEAEIAFHSTASKVGRVKRLADGKLSFQPQSSWQWIAVEPSVETGLNGETLVTYSGKADYSALGWTVFMLVGLPALFTLFGAIFLIAFHVTTTRAANKAFEETAGRSFDVL